MTATQRGDSESEGAKPLTIRFGDNEGWVSFSSTQSLGFLSLTGPLENKDVVNKAWALHGCSSWSMK